MGYSYKIKSPVVYMQGPLEKILKFVVNVKNSQRYIKNSQYGVAEENGAFYKALYFVRVSGVDNKLLVP